MSISHSLARTAVSVLSYFELRKNFERTSSIGYVFHSTAAITVTAEYFTIGVPSPFYINEIEKNILNFLAINQ